MPPPVRHQPPVGERFPIPPIPAIPPASHEAAP